MSAESDQWDVLGHAREKLLGSGYALLGNLECRFRDGELILTGTVPSYYLKQCAQTVVMSVDGVDRLTNRVEVGGRS